MASIPCSIIPTLAFAFQSQCVFLNLLSQFGMNIILCFKITVIFWRFYTFKLWLTVHSLERDLAGFSLLNILFLPSVLPFISILKLFQKRSFAFVLLLKFAINWKLLNAPTHLRSEEKGLDVIYLASNCINECQASIASTNTWMCRNCVYITESDHMSIRWKEVGDVWFCKKLVDFSFSISIL